MLHIVLLILKIAGIIIAVLLGLVLLVLAALLFVPIRYTILAQYYEKPVLKAKISWFLHLLRATAEYDDEFRMKVKVLFFSLYRSDAEEKEKVSKRKHQDTQQTFFDELEQREQNVTKIPEKKKTEYPKQENQPEPESKSVHLDKEQPVKETVKKSKFQIFRETILDFYRRITAFIKGIIDKSISVKEVVAQKATAISDMVNDSDNREMLQFLLDNTKKLLRKIKPYQYRVKVRYGFGDPETTGWLAVRLAVIYGLLGMDMELIPDFDESIFEGDIYLKGKVRLFGILLIVWRVYRNKLVQEKIIKKNH